MSKIWKDVEIHHARKFFKIAEKAMKRSITDVDEVISTIILSTSAFESFLNEFTNSMKVSISEKDSKMLQVLKSVGPKLDEKKFNSLLRLEIFYFFLCSKQLPKGERPFQDIKLLYEIRNSIVHPRPEKVSVEFSQNANQEKNLHRYLKHLVDIKVINKPWDNFDKGEVYGENQWFDYIFNNKVAEWAYNTVVNVASEIINATPESDFKNFIAFVCKHISGIKIEGI